MKVYLGIDFGAENIYISYKRDVNDSIELLTGIDGANNYIKNYYAIDSEKREYFGNEAHEKSFDKGVSFYSKYKQYIAKPSNEFPPVFRNFPPETIMCKVFTHLRKVIDNRLKALHNTDRVTVNACVVTVPYGWQNNDTCKRVYRKAITKAGFDKFRLVDEPTAAAANVIAVAKNLLPRDQVPKNNDNVMVVDIGASTIDVNICANGNPIKAFEGTSKLCAGNHVDMKLLSIIADMRYEDIDPQKDRSPLDLAQEMKHFPWQRIRRMQKCEDPRKIRGKEARLEHFKEVANYYANYVADIINGVVGSFAQGHNNANINFLVICGGMSEYDHASFPEALFEKIRDTPPNYFDSCVFMNKHREISHDLRQRTIANGAAMLAKDPALVLQKLGYDVYVNLKHKEDSLFILMIPKETVLGEDSGRISLWDAVQGHPKFRSDDIGGLTAKDLIDGDNLRVSIDRVEYDEISFEFDKATKKEILDTSKNNGRRDDLVGSLDSDGIISFEIIDKGGKAISSATFKKSEESILRM